MSVLFTPAVETLFFKVSITNFIQTRHLHAFMGDHVLTFELLLLACSAAHMHVPDLTTCQAFACTPSGWISVTTATQHMNFLYFSKSPSKHGELEQSICSSMDD